MTTKPAPPRLLADENTFHRFVAVCRLRRPFPIVHLGLASKAAFVLMIPAGAILIRTRVVTDHRARSAPEAHLTVVRCSSPGTSVSSAAERSLDAARAKPSMTTSGRPLPPDAQAATDAVAKLVQSLYPGASGPSGALYHYTSLAGLIGVLDTGELWASELRSLNDTTELTRGLDLLARAASEHPNSASDDQVRRQFVEWIEQRSGYGPMMFAAAFTEEGNLLSQWRGYCPAGAGVSFGVSYAHITACASANRFRLGKCIYEPVRQKELARIFTDLVLEAARVEGPNTRLDPSQSYHSTFYRLEEQVLHWCALMKHDAFRAEMEWRAVSEAHVDYVRGTGASIRYRVGSSMLIPYVGFSLRNVAGIVPVDTLITGPTPHPDRATESMQRLVARHMQGLHGPWQSRYCQIPYRAW